jgi:AraC-like DNA-binding protein
MHQNLYQSFEIVYKEVDECPLKDHKHNFFELVYILAGTGMQCINKNSIPYDRGNLFLLTPADCHAFDVQTRTQFFFLRFGSKYLNALKENGSEDGILVQQMEFILQNASHQPGCILYNKGDKPLVKTLVETIIREHLNQEPYHQELIRQLVNTMITLVARNISMKLPEKINKASEEAIMQIIRYIQENIYNPEQLRVERISDTFGISKDYLGRYFRKHSGESLQQYITNYKLKLVEARLGHSNMRINEIVNELSFTDESHLNRLFKKHKGVSPSEYRKKLMLKSVPL